MKPALLFDLDGTLTDDDELHFIAMRDAFAEQGVALDWDGFRGHIVGALNADIAAHFLPHLSAQDGARVLADKEAIFRTRVGKLTLMPGALALLDFARAQGVALGLVTNAPRLNADAMLTAFGIKDRFQAIVTGDDVARGKPDPLPYLAALDALDANPARSLAFEDSKTGATAATRAGLTTIGIAAPENAAALASVGVALTARDFTDPRVMALARETLGL